MILVVTPLPQFPQYLVIGPAGCGSGVRDGGTVAGMVGADGGSIWGTIAAIGWPQLVQKAASDCKRVPQVTQFSSMIAADICGGVVGNGGATGTSNVSGVVGGSVSWLIDVCVSGGATCGV